MTTIELRIVTRENGRYNVDLSVDGVPVRASRRQPSLYEALLTAGLWLREIMERERTKPDADHL